MAAFRERACKFSGGFHSALSAYCVFLDGVFLRSSSLRISILSLIRPLLDKRPRLSDTHPIDYISSSNPHCDTPRKEDHNRFRTLPRYCLYQSRHPWPTISSFTFVWDPRNQLGPALRTSSSGCLHESCVHIVTCAYTSVGTWYPSLFQISVAS